MALVFPSIHTKNALTLPIREWITLASYWETKQLKNADDKAAAEARLEYVNRAAARALTLTEEFAFSGDNDSDSDSDEEDPPPPQPAAFKSSIPEDHFDNTAIVAENFEVHVRFQVHNHETNIFADLELPSLSSAAKVIEKCTDEQIKAILDSTPSVRFISSLRDKKRVDLDRRELEFFLRKAGLLFYEFFSRGSIYQNVCAATNGQNGAAESSDPNNQNGKSDNGEGGYDGRGKTARMHANHIFGEIGNITLKDVEDELREKQLPMSICRLVGDLIHADATFESTLDILDELEGIIDEPDIFMDDIDQVPLSLDFHEDSLFGRTDERFEISEALNNAQTLSQEHGTNSIIFIGGDPGSGKSHLANDILRIRSNRWSCLSCKFDQVAQNNQSLSVITSALENYFRGLVTEPLPGLEEILGSIYRRILAPGIVVLSKWIPSFRALYPTIFSGLVEDDSSDESEAGVQESKDDSGEGDNVDDEHEESNNNDNEEEEFFNANAFRNRLHYLIRQVFHAISSPLNPMLLLLDDLQWAERDSLDLVSSLLMESHQLQNIGAGHGLPPCLILMGTIRSNEVDRYHMLTEYLLSFEASDSVNVTNINLTGIDAKSAHSMISHALGLPSRLTRSLAEATQRKTLGNPLFIKTFLTSLVKEKSLNYSLAEKRWIWEIKAITAQPIDDNVAMIMKRSILRMPQAARFALTVASCFGSSVDASDLQLLSSSEQFSNIMSSLDYAIRASVMEKRGTLYVFVHDMIQQTAYHLLPRPQIEQLHFNIGVQLATATWNSGPLCSDAILMRATDQVNAAKTFAFSDSQVQMTFAALNKQAADNSIKRTDFSSALSYVKQGLQFLGENGWDTDHDLCLQLHDTACLASYLNALHDDALVYHETIISHTHTLQQQLKSHFIVIQTLASMGKPNEAIDEALAVLEKLGEKFPIVVTPAVVEAELKKTRIHLGQFTPETLPRMSGDKELWAMKLMNVITACSFMVHPSMIPILGSRMVQLSLRHGICRETVVGLLLFGHAIMGAFNNVEQGNWWVKKSMCILKKLNADSLVPKMNAYKNILFSFWVEPMQSTAIELSKSREDCLLVGDIESSSLSALFHYSQSIMCGIGLSSLALDFKLFLAENIKLKQIHVILPLLSYHNAVVKLTGSDFDPFSVAGVSVQNEDELLEHALISKRPTLAQVVFFNRMFVAVYMNNFGNVIRNAENYKTSRHKRFLDIYHVFYQGLAAFHFSRAEANDSKWMELGEQSVVQYRSWVNNSLWNFENKLLLLEAEELFSHGKNAAAEAKYKAAFESARSHNFLHEEGLAHDLLGSFYFSCGEFEKEKKSLWNAYDCYNRWGAEAVLMHSRFDEVRT